MKHRTIPDPNSRRAGGVGVADSGTISMTPTSALENRQSLRFVSNVALSTCKGDGSGFHGRPLQVRSCAKLAIALTIGIRRVS
jgi:hypothetical protein